MNNAMDLYQISPNYFSDDAYLVEKKFYFIPHRIMDKLF
jgi:hypothetical protein